MVYRIPGTDPWEPKNQKIFKKSKNILKTEKTLKNILKIFWYTVYLVPGSLKIEKFLKNRKNSKINSKNILKIRKNF